MGRGTPKTLNQAIQNAFIEYKKENKISESRLRKLLNSALRDFVRNGLGPAFLINEDKAVSEALHRFLKKL